MLHNKHLIAGNWVGSEAEFANAPVSGEADKFAIGLPQHIKSAVEAAEQAFETYGSSSRSERAKFLTTIANEIEARGKEITEIGVRETGLPEARLNGERGRTTGQLRMFADHIAKGDYLDRRHDVTMKQCRIAPHCRALTCE